MFALRTSHHATQGQNPCKAPIAQWIERLPPKERRTDGGLALASHNSIPKESQGYADSGTSRENDVRGAYVE